MNKRNSQKRLGKTHKISREIRLKIAPQNVEENRLVSELKEQKKVLDEVWNSPEGQAEHIIDMAKIFI